MRRGKGGGRIVIALAVVAIPTRAAAVEREHHLGGDLGGGALVASGHAEPGGAVAVHWAYGLNDMFNLMVEGSTSLMGLGTPQDPTHTRPNWAANAGVGVGYVFDVSRWVPYVGVLAGGCVLWGGAVSRAKVLPDAVLALGLDYRLTRSFAVGVSFRQHMLVTEMATYPSFTQVFARAEYTLGW